MKVFYGAVFWENTDGRRLLHPFVMRADSEADALSEAVRSAADDDCRPSDGWLVSHTAVFESHLYQRRDEVALGLVD